MEEWREEMRKRRKVKMGYQEKRKRCIREKKKNNNYEKQKKGSQRMETRNWRKTRHRTNVGNRGNRIKVKLVVVNKIK